MKRIIAIIFLILTISLVADNNGKNAITLQNLQGEIVHLFDTPNEKPKVFLFWATWCIPCREELKQMKSIYKEFSDVVDFIAVSVDDPRTVSKVNSYVRKYKLPYTILLDTDQQVIRKFGGSVPPFSVVLDQTGNVIYSHSGYRKGDELTLKKLLLENFSK
ncbi:MAG: hypothetical protein Kow00108_12670 [Calditrichia bacterium]